MTRIARRRSQPRPRWDDWKACAVPCKLVVTSAGSVSRATLWTSLTASPSDVPGLRLKDSVTAGSWPMWLTVSGPTDRSSRLTVSSGTRAPLAERT